MTRQNHVQDTSCVRRLLESRYAPAITHASLVLLTVSLFTLLLTVPTQMMTHTFEPLQYLLLSNFVDPAAPSRASGVPFYFAEIYAQLFVIAALLFSSVRVRGYFSRQPFASAVALVFIADRDNSRVQVFTLSR
mgnify:CR=1 FL=1